MTPMILLAAAPIFSFVAGWAFLIEWEEDNRDYWNNQKI